MKKIKRTILAALLCASMLVGIISPLSTATASAAETATGTEPGFSNTKYMISNSKEHMLIATGIKNYEDVYEVGYAFKGMDGITKLHAVTTKYYTSITSGSNTWNVSSLFGSEYTGMVVWEVAYDTAKDYAYEVYAKVGNRVDGQLVATDNIVYGTRKDVVNNYAATFVVGNDFVEERAITVGEPYGKLPEAPASDIGPFMGWYLNADGEGEAITADTLVTTKGNHTLYAIYDNKISYDFSDQSQLDIFDNAQNVTYEIESYLKVTGTPGSESILVLKKELTAGQTVEIDVEYVGQNVAFDNGQITFLAYTANVAGDPDGNGSAVKGNAPWDGDWDCKQTTVLVEVTQDCAGIRMQFVMNSDAGAYFKITGIRISESDEYDFSDQSQLDDFANAKNVTYEIVNEYLKVVGTQGATNILVLKEDLIAGQVVEIDVEYVTSDATFVNEVNQFTFLAYTANAGGDADGKTTSVMGSAPWDGGWNAGNTTVSTTVTQDCAGIRMQFVMNNVADSYFKITGIRIITPVYPIVYDFSDESQLNDFVELEHGGKKIVTDETGTYAKFTPTDTNNLYSVFWLKQDLKAGMTVEMDFELVGTIATNHGIWTWGADANGGAQFDGQFVTGWDAPTVWNGGKFTSTTNITADCYGVRIQMKYGDNAEAYWKLTEVRIIAPVEYPIAYDLSDESTLDDFVELEHGGKKIVTDETGTYAKFTPTDTNNLYSVFWLKQDLKAGMTVEMDFELVGTIATNHGIWTWGADANGGAQFDGQFVTGWDAPTVWNGGKFTSTTNIMADCYGVRIQMKYGDNANAYWKLTSIRILDGSTLPTYKVTMNNNGNETTSDIVFGEKYGTILPDTTPAQAHMEFRGWYMNPAGTGAPITADTAMTIKDDHTIYAVYEENEEYPRVSDFFETEQPTNIRDVDNTTITPVRDASGNYIKLSPTTTGDTTNANYPQSEFVFSYPYLEQGWVVEMDFELVCNDVNSAQGIYTYEADQNGNKLGSEKSLMTLWDAGETAWNGGKFTAVTRITQACQGVRVLVRYANNPAAYWKLTGIRVYTPNEYLDVPTYVDDKQIDIGATSWLGTDQTINYFNGEIGEANFKKLQEAGITTLAGTFYGDTGSVENETELLDMAARYGIGLYFQKSWDGETIPSYVSHEAFLGYYIDEPNLDELGDIGTLQQKWDSSAFGENGKLLYVNLLPIYSDEAGNSYDSYLSTAIDKGLQMVSYDHYAMYYKAKEVFGYVYGYESELSSRTDWLQNFDIASSYAKVNNIPLWYTLLATQHLADGDLTKYKDPNVNDLTYQMYVAMTYGATHLTHYTFAGTGDYIIDGAMFNQNTGEWTQTYNDVNEANAIIREWDHVFMNFDWLGVSAITGTSAQTGFINSLTHSINVDANGVMKSVTATQDVLVGHFKDVNGYAGVMLTNLTLPEKNTASDVTITFNDEYQAVKVYMDGEEQLVYLNNGQATITLDSAEGVFLIPVKAK